jgi:hypothetical protein
MNYIKLATGEYPRHQGDVRLEYPDMGAPFVLPETYAHVQNTEMPEHDYDTQRAEEAPPVMIDGVWVMQWRVREATPEEIGRAEELRNPLPPINLE